MPTKDSFTPDEPSPLFLSERADELEQQRIRKVLDRAVISSRILKASILVVTATAIGSAILWMGNPVTLFADVTASPVDISALKPGTDQSTPAVQSTADAQPVVQSTADAQALPPTAKDAPPVNPESAPPSDDKTAAKDAPTRDEIAAASEPAGQSQTENSKPPSSEALFKQFQAWVAEEDARTQVGPVQPTQDAPAPVRSAQKHRRVRPEQNARAEIRHVQKPRAKVRREQNAQVGPAQDARQDARAQD
jgi:hypothetical protein